ncbi:methylamine [Arenimonas maotaiensis]|uniref:Methylamine n=1 Tax=Arenimonas maotaiensis TaxID=1446479 RepID=A0A917FRH3_9GAMM|nr:FAD-dependent oxidoreductase [Arenimonas maotaiensis]GGF96363.1 methylamine [Arenimonas maotaiensis]
MARDPRYDILFEPVQIGPVTARNRFYQVPHCNGMGHQMPEAHAAMREIKAQGGWAVVSTEECEIHPSGDVTPYVEARLWDDGDIPTLALMCEKVKAHGALSAVELTHNGYTASNLYSREVPLSPSPTPLKYGYPLQARAMTLHDIREYRRWHKNAAIRAKRAGFDIVYVYAAHDLSLAMHFLQRRRNQRTDDYGGSLENRLRLLREVLQDTKDAVGDTCAVALRFATEEFLGEGGVQNAEAKEIVQHLADLPDLWDVNVAAWYNDSLTSRFGAEGYQQPFTAWVKQATSKPVVGVGRFTSPDTMARLVREGALDLIGAARPSIADPFLPKKIETGAIDSIRECIGCNICVSGDMTITPIRCTQNPSMGEEWRKGWHPEHIPARKSEKRVLVVGAGPAGLEATRALGQRGYEVMLAEAGEQLGGRVLKESALPGLSEWRRVRDWRVGRIEPMPNVSVFRGNELGAEDVLAIGADAVVIATGAHWVRTGIGRAASAPFIGHDSAQVFTPDDLMAGRFPDAGPVLLYDDDGFYLASVLAEVLAARGHEVHYVTPEDTIAGWTANTLDYRHIQKRLRKLGVHLHTAKTLEAFDGGQARLACVWSEDTLRLPVSSVVTVTMRLPNDALYQDLLARQGDWQAAGITQVRCLGDAEAPGLIAHAVYAGHRFAREFEAAPGENGDAGDVPFRRVRQRF